MYLRTVAQNKIKKKQKKNQREELHFNIFTPNASTQ